MARRRWALIVALSVAGAFALPSGAIAGERPHGNDQLGQGSGQSEVAPDYQNPLDLRMPDGDEVVSCADPAVIRGQAAGDANWYLYCTTDPMTETERDASGSLVFHLIPTFTSTDLIQWTYSGDVFAERPAWVAPTAGLWAPDIEYNDGKYFLYYTASDTTLPGGGSAIGVATSASPTGPWTEAGAPVVPPRPGGDGTARLWTFDPEVVYTADTAYIYFGSYFGGIWARELSEDGLASDAGTQTQIAVDNRYEGTYIIERDGWYYFFGSAADCCRGPLTGYSVFTARSRSPLGPFVDKHGIPIMATRVGGTPVLTQNGNRWVGTGHNAVVTDFDGQDWTIYHAVDQSDPYFAGTVGFTKRPALIDPLDWERGWPVVRGDEGPSDMSMPGPAAQPGQQTDYRPRIDDDPKLGKRYPGLSDEFSGRTLSRQWSWVRPGAVQYAVTGGAFRFPTQAADIHPPDQTGASVLTEPTPRGDYVVETKLSVSVPNDGSVHNYVQGGLLIYGDDANYVKLSSTSMWNTRQTEFMKQAGPVPAGFPTFGNAVVGPVGDATYLRIVHRETGDTGRYTAYTSLDGRRWDRGATWVHALGGTPRIGLVSMGGAGFESVFDYVRVYELRD
jgi:arabinan endo-1,5-alpha-L-arabinosidase